MDKDFEEREKRLAEVGSKLIMEVLYGEDPRKKECKKESPPNLRDGKCCGTCVNGSRGYEFEVYCNKYEKWVGVDEICDEWDEA